MNVNVLFNPPQTLKVLFLGADFQEHEQLVRGVRLEYQTLVNFRDRVSCEGSKYHQRGGFVELTDKTSHVSEGHIQKTLQRFQRERDQERVRKERKEKDGTEVREMERKRSEEDQLEQVKHLNKVSKEVMRLFHENFDDVLSHYIEQKKFFNIIHLTTHGERDGLYWSDSDHDSVRSCVQAISRVCSPTGSVIILNACKTAAVAKELAKCDNVVQVVYTSGDLKPDDAVHFVTGYFSHLQNALFDNGFAPVALHQAFADGRGKCRRPSIYHSDIGAGAALGRSPVKDLVKRFRIQNPALCSYAEREIEAIKVALNENIVPVVILENEAQCLAFGANLSNAVSQEGYGSLAEILQEGRYELVLNVSAYTLAQSSDDLGSVLNDLRIESSRRNMGLIQDCSKNVLWVIHEIGKYLRCTSDPCPTIQALAANQGSLSFVKNFIIVDTFEDFFKFGEGSKLRRCIVSQNQVPHAAVDAMRESFWLCKSFEKCYLESSLLPALQSFYKKYVSCMFDEIKHQVPSDRAAKRRDGEHFRQFVSCPSKIAGALFCRWLGYAKHIEKGSAPSLLAKYDYVIAVSASELERCDLTLRILLDRIFGIENPAVVEECRKSVDRILWVLEDADSKLTPRLWAILKERSGKDWLKNFIAVSAKCPDDMVIGSIMLAKVPSIFLEQLSVDAYPEISSIFNERKMSWFGVEEHVLISLLERSMAVSSNNLTTTERLDADVEGMLTEVRKRTRRDPRRRLSKLAWETFIGDSELCSLIANDALKRVYDDDLEMVDLIIQAGFFGTRQGVVTCWKDKNVQAFLAACFLRFEVPASLCREKIDLMFDFEKSLPRLSLQAFFGHFWALIDEKRASDFIYWIQLERRRLIKELNGRWLEECCRNEWDSEIILDGAFQYSFMDIALCGSKELLDVSCTTWRNHFCEDGIADSLHQACFHGYIFVVHTILKVWPERIHDYSEDETFLQAACSIEVCQVLLDHGANVNGVCVWPFYTNLMRAANFEKARFLLDNNAKIDAVDSFGNNAMHHFFEDGKFYMIEQLLSSQKYGKQFQNLMTSSNNQGRTPIFFGAHYFGEVQRDEGRDEFFTRRKRPCEDLFLFELFLMEGFPFDKSLLRGKDKFGFTPFHYACSVGVSEWAELMNFDGASEIRDNEGKLPIESIPERYKKDFDFLFGK